MALNIQRKKNVNVMRIGMKIAMTILALYISGFLVNVIGGIMNCTQSPFYSGLELIGWTVEDNVNTSLTCSSNAASLGNPANNVITDITGEGILAIIGLIAIAFVVFEFVDIGWT